MGEKPWKNFVLERERKAEGGHNQHTLPREGEEGGGKKTLPGNGYREGEGGLFVWILNWLWQKEIAHKGNQDDFPM